MPFWLFKYKTNIDPKVGGIAVVKAKDRHEAKSRFLIYVAHEYHDEPSYISYEIVELPGVEEVFVETGDAQLHLIDYID